MPCLEKLTQESLDIIKGNGQQAQPGDSNDTITSDGQNKDNMPGENVIDESSGSTRNG